MCVHVHMHIHIHIIPMYPYIYAMMKSYKRLVQQSMEKRCALLTGGTHPFRSSGWGCCKSEKCNLRSIKVEVGAQGPETCDLRRRFRPIRLTMTIGCVRMRRCADMLSSSSSSPCACGSSTKPHLETIIIIIIVVALLLLLLSAARRCNLFADYPEGPSEAFPATPRIPDFREVSAREVLRMMIRIGGFNTYVCVCIYIYIYIYMYA